MLRAIWFAMLGSLLVATALANDKPSHNPPLHLDHEGARWAERTLHKLTVEEKVGQLFMIWARAEFLNVSSPEYLKLRDSLRKYHVGGFAMTVPWEPPFLQRTQPYEAAELLNRLQKDSPLPLLVAADFERGLSMRLHGATEFPHAMAFGAAAKLDYAEAFGRVTAQEARAIGVHWNFFPDADVNSNPANPIINTRSFGEDPKQVGDLAAAYIRGAHAAGMMTTAKHFPGHGDTATDSHLGVARVTGDRAHLDAVELLPFQRAIAAGVDAVMVGHVTIPALDPDPNLVATISPAIVTGLLRVQLGFKGIIVTDALDMAGLTRLYSANPGRTAVDAFLAGNDLLLIPADLEASYRAVLAAVATGEISPARLNASVLKLLQAKAALGLPKNRFVDVDLLSTAVGKPENLALGQQIAEDAITLVRDNGKLLPLKESGTVETSIPYQPMEGPGNGLVVVIFSDDIRVETGRALERQIKSRVPGASVFYVDLRIADAVSTQVLRAVDGAQSVIAAVFAAPVPGTLATPRANGFNNSVTLGEESGTLLQRILYHAPEKTAVLAMGSPYVASDLSNMQNYLCSFSNTPVSEVAMVKALFGEIPVHGHSPVSIPNIAPRGAGIERATRFSFGEPHHAN